MVSELLTANALEPDHETWLFRSAISARRRHSASMRPAPITADKLWSLKFAYAVGNPTLYMVLYDGAQTPISNIATPKHFT